MSGAVQVRDRKFKPLPWSVNFGGLAADCRWSWQGLLLAWPLWEDGFDSVDFGTSAFQRQQARDPIRGRHGGIIGFTAAGVDWTGSYRGRVARVQNTVPGRISTPTSEFLPTTQGSVVLHYRKTDATLRAAGAVGIAADGTANKQLGVHLPWTDGNVYWDWGGFSGSNRATASGLTFGDDVWVFTNGTRGMEIWQNGVRRAQNGSGATRAATTSEDWGLFTHFNNNQDLAEAGCLLLYDRQLSESEITRLSIDPWTPFRPARGRGGLAFSAGTIARVTQAIAEIMHAPDAAIRATQVVGEIMRSPDPALRATQVILEAMIPQFGIARVSQIVMEVMVSTATGTGRARVSQALLEVMRSPSPTVRATQVILEAMVSPDVTMRLTQVVAEIMWQPVPTVRVSQAVLEAMVKPTPLSVPLTGLLFPRGSVPPF